MDVESRSEHWLSSSINFYLTFFETETPIEPGFCLFGWTGWPQSPMDPLSCTGIKRVPHYLAFHVCVGNQKPETMLA